MMRKLSWVLLVLLAFSVYAEDEKEKEVDSVYAEEVEKETDSAAAETETDSNPEKLEEIKKSKYQEFESRWEDNNYTKYLLWFGCLGTILFYGILGAIYGP